MGEKEKWVEPGEAVVRLIRTIRQVELGVPKGSLGWGTRGPLPSLTNEIMIDFMAVERCGASAWHTLRCQCQAPLLLSSLARPEAAFVTPSWLAPGRGTLVERAQQEVAGEGGCGNPSSVMRGACCLSSHL